jgi:hypothetical protein
MKADITSRTPGYNCRLVIWFTVEAGGRQVAYYWAPQATRAIRLPLDKAKIMEATGTADVTCCHPLRPHTCGK